MNINIGNLEYALFYEMNKNELLNYLKNDLDFNNNTYPYLNHEEILNMSEEDLRKLIIGIVDENDHCMEINKANLELGCY